MAKNTCVFCDIISGKERSWTVYRDRHIMALLDVFPVTRGHTLIIPIRHYESMWDIPQNTLDRITALAKKLCKSYEKTLGMQGVSIEVLNHKQKNQAYRHFHLHVIPRYDKNHPRDPANVKPSQRFPRESGENLNRTLRILKEGN